jgi:Arc/MetJ-type ribon-helix-helix transcriptional regulator
MSIEITPEVESLVHGIYSHGHYASEADVLAAALQLLQQRDQLRAELMRGCDELDRGERISGEELFSELRQRAMGLDEERA